jgi:hypothetical protein
MQPKRCGVVVLGRRVTSALYNIAKATKHSARYGLAFSISHVFNMHFLFSALFLSGCWSLGEQLAKL